MRSAIFIFVLFAQGFAHAGGDVGNGGDVVLCQKSEQNPFQGALSLDYMLTLQNGSENAIRSVNSFSDSMSRISKIMNDRCREYQKPKGAGFSASLKEFLNLRDNHDNWSFPYIWNASAYGLVDIHDERISRLLPSNCQSDKGPNIIQAIIRKQRNDMNIIVFEYDPKIDLELQRQPLQQSFLYMHEFLRNYLVDIDQLRWLNWFLHSQKMETLSDSEFQTSINRLMGTAFCGPLP